LRYCAEMKRKSIVITHSDDQGSYESEIFDAPKAKRVIVCSHGNGVRRWDGKHFFHEVAEYFKDSAVMLVDQNQREGNGVRLNPFPTMIMRVQGLIAEAKVRYPNTPIIVLGHSMGCAVASYLDLTGVNMVIFEAPGAGSQEEGLIKRYGPDVLNGKIAETDNGRLKVITKEFVQSVIKLNWDDAYAELLKKFKPVYVYEAGEEEIVGEARIAYRSFPFTKYEIIPHAKHNLSGEPLADFLSRLDSVFKTI
jgi:Serine aminopeptidase, S33